MYYISFETYGEHNIHSVYENCKDENETLAQTDNKELGKQLLSSCGFCNFTYEEKDGIKWVASVTPLPIPDPKPIPYIPTKEDEIFEILGDMEERDCLRDLGLL